MSLPTDPNEVRVISTTGGEKATKLARFDLIPSESLWRLAEHYGAGAKKYDDDNWRRGYSWRLNIAAMQRHLHQWLMDDYTEDHLAAIAWHAFTLMWFEKYHPEFDDRWIEQQGDRE